MKHILLSDQLTNDEKFSGLLEEIHKHEEAINFYLTCGGGNMGHASLLIDIINKQPDRFSITGMHLYSAGFYLFYHTKCERKLLPGALGMFHYPYVRIEVAANFKAVYNQDRNIIDNWNIYEYSYWRNFCETFMTPKELGKLEEADEVYFTTPRLKEIFPTVPLSEV